MCVLGSAALTARTQSLPPDVRAGHWAAGPVQSVLRNQVLTLDSDKGFHGDARVTHKQAVLALAKLARALEAGTWQATKSVPLSVAKTGVAPKTGTWESQTVTRYVFSTVLARIGDYAAAGLTRPKPDEKDLGKSIALPPAVSVSLPKSNAAYESLAYLAERRMIGRGSPLLTADDNPLKAAEMSRAMRELVAGLTDRLTDLGHDENGATNDDALRNKPKKN